MSHNDFQWFSYWSLSLDSLFHQLDSRLQMHRPTTTTTHARKKKPFYVISKIIAHTTPKIPPKKLIIQFWCCLRKFGPHSPPYALWRLINLCDFYNKVIIKFTLAHIHAFQVNSFLHRTTAEWARFEQHSIFFDENHSTIDLNNSRFFFSFFIFNRHKNANASERTFKPKIYEVETNLSKSMWAIASGTDTIVKKTKQQQKTRRKKPSEKLDC